MFHLKNLSFRVGANRFFVSKRVKNNNKKANSKKMRHIVLLLMLMSAVCSMAQDNSTVKQQMDRIHAAYGVDFIYDSDLKVNVPCREKATKGMRLKDALNAVFKGTDITFTVKGRYVILRQNKELPAKGVKTKTAKRRYTLSGFVKDENGEPLISATVYDTGSGSGTTTNAYGFYSITLYEGTHLVRASYVGYDDHTETISLNSDRHSDIALRQNANIKEVVVTGDMNSRVLTTQTGKRTLQAEDINTEFSLLSSPDLVKTLQHTSGVSEGLELASGMYVHGGNDDENLFLIDGTPLYQINHAVGLFSAFNTDVIKTVDFYKSGFPARYGGRLSSITDVRTNDGDMFHTHGSYTVGLLDGRFHLEGPISRGRTSYNIGIRRTWSDLLSVPLFAAINAGNNEEKLSLRYFLHDVNAKLTHIFSPRSRVYLSLYSGMDYLKTKDDYDESDDSYINRDLTRCSLTWGNINAALNWNYVFSPRLFANFSGLFTYNRSIYKYYADERFGSNYIDRTHTDHRGSSKIYDTGAHAAFDWRPNVSNHVRFGADYTWHVFRPQTQTRYDYSGEEPDISDTVAIRSSNRHIANELNLYAEDEIRLSPRWNINLGAHGTMFAIGQKTFFSIDPRTALKYQLTAATSLKLSFTGMTQTVHRLGNTYLSMPTDYWVPTTERLRPMRSWQLAAGVYSRLGARWAVSLEGYYKTTAHLYMYTHLNGLTPPAGNWDLFVSEGKGRFYGVEVDATYRDSRVTLDMAYTLSWNKRLFSELYSSWFYDKFDNRHKLNLQLRYKINKKAEMYAAWICKTGNRFSMPTQWVAVPDVPYGGIGSYANYTLVYEKLNNLVLPLYHRLDLGFNLRHTTKKGHERVWNISLYNAYCRMNRLYAELKFDKTGKPSLRAKGYVPIVPSASYTIKF